MCRINIAPGNILLRASMPSTLRAALRAFKIIPDNFVEPGFEPNPLSPPYKKAPLRSPFYMAEREGFEPSMRL